MPLANTSCRPSVGCSQYINPVANRKTPHQSRVEEMMQKIRLLGGLSPTPSLPCIPLDTMILAQAKLILEEFLELMEACGLEVVTDLPRHGLDTGAQMVEVYALPRGTLRLQPIPGYSINLPEVAKEAADLSVVTTGLFSEFGIADAPILEEVDSVNLTKFAPGGYLDTNRKWRKPPNFKEADLRPILIAQGWTDDTTTTS